MICIFTCFIAQNFGPQSFNLFEEVVRVLPPRSLNCHCSRHPAQYRRDSETDECKLNGGSQKWAEQGSHQVWRQAIKSVTLEGFDWWNRLFFTRSKMFSSASLTPHFCRLPPWQSWSPQVQQTLKPQTPVKIEVKQARCSKGEICISKRRKTWLIPLLAPISKVHWLDWCSAKN